MPVSRGTGLPVVLAILGLLAVAPVTAAQVPAEPVLAGVVTLGDSALGDGTVALHQVTGDFQGVIDSIPVGPGGVFSFALPAVPNGAAGEIYFASVRYAGVEYFGVPIERAVQLDSIYEIHAYDTIVAPAEGVPLIVQARYVFIEQADSAWMVADLFELYNDRDGTLVPSDEGRVWSYPLPAGARDLVVEGEVGSDVLFAEDGALVLRAAMPPGPAGARSFMVRYAMDSPEMTLPTPGSVEAIDVLVREPAPPLEVDGLVMVESVQMDASSTFRRFTANGLSVPEIRISMGAVQRPPPVRWIAVLLALVLAGGGLIAFRGGRTVADEGTVATAGATGGRMPVDRNAVLVEIARLDEAYERNPSPSEAETQEYRRRRAELLARVSSGG